MLLRSRISSTKRFFKKSIQTLRSFWSGGYVKLPKNPSLIPISCSTVTMNTCPMTQREFDEFFSDYANIWNPNKAKQKNGNRIHRKTISLGAKQGKGIHDRKNNHAEKLEEDEKKKGKTEESYSQGLKGRSLFVEEKLKELEMMDVSNVDHVMDIEEVLHYYSRITCPAYVDIIDKFFTDIYSQFFRQGFTD